MTTYLSLQLSCQHPQPIHSSSYHGSHPRHLSASPLHSPPLPFKQLNKRTNKQTNEQTNKQTNSVRQTNKQTNKQTTNKQVDRHAFNHPCALRPDNSVVLTAVCVIEMLCGIKETSRKEHIQMTNKLNFVHCNNCQESGKRRRLLRTGL